MPGKHRLRYFALLICVVAIKPVDATEKVETTHEAAGNAFVEVHAKGGEFRIVGWPKKQVRVAGDLTAGIDELEFQALENGKRIYINVPGSPTTENGSTNLEIQVPVASRLRFYAVSGNIELKQLEGGIEVVTISGNISVEQVLGSMSFQSSSGNLRILESRGKVRSQVSSGNTVAQVDGPEHEFSSGSGKLNLTLGTVNRLRVHSINGNIEVSTHLARGGKVELQSVNGNCRLTLAGDINAGLEATTGAGGKIVNGLDESKPNAVFPASARLSMQLGKAEGAIETRSVTGDIELYRDEE